MVMADKDDIAKSSFGRNEMPVHSLTGWGWSRFDRSNGLIDKSKKGTCRPDTTALPVSVPMYYMCIVLCI